MTENKPSSEKRIKIDPFYPRLVAAGLLAAAGAYFFVPYRGPVSALFPAVVSAALCAPLRLDWRIKAGLFALFGYFFPFRLCAHGDGQPAVRARLRGDKRAFCCLCRALLRRRTAKNVLLLLPAAAAVCLAVLRRQPVFPPFSAGETLSDYVNSTHAADEFAASPVYYDRKSGEYRLDLHAEDDPDRRVSHRAARRFVRDAYLSYAESRLLEDMRLELVQLRAAYPSEGYAVVPAGISRFPTGLSRWLTRRPTTRRALILRCTFQRRHTRRVFQAGGEISENAVRRGRGRFANHLPRRQPREYHYAVTCPVTQLPINETPAFDVSSRLGRLR